MPGSALPSSDVGVFTPMGHKSTLSRSLLLMATVALILASVLTVPAFGLYGSYAESCAEVKALNPAAGDGQYTLALGGQTANVYCADMAGTPAEYISLAVTGGTNNYAMFEGDHVDHRYRYYLIRGTDAITHYNKVRIDPTTLVVDQRDLRFAVITSEGVNGYDWSNPSFKPVPKTMPYGTAGDCYNMGSARGTGNVNLTGTDFALADTTQFAVDGWAANGSINIDAGRQVVNLVGGGWCGGAGPTGPLKLKLLTAAIPLDQNPPVTTASAPSGWQNQDVTVILTATDDVSGVAATYYEVNGGAAQQGTSISINTDGVHSIAFWSVDNAGNVEVKQSVTVQVDKTVPTITYSGNAGSYTVDQAVAITCAASDNLSGVASDTCQDLSGPAYTFALGANSYSASATDNAGNLGEGSTSFTVSVTYDSLCNLTKQFSSKADVASALCAKLDAAEASAERGNAKSAAGQIEAYLNQVKAQSGKALTAEQAAILAGLAGAL